MSHLYKTNTDLSKFADGTVLKKFNITQEIIDEYKLPLILTKDGFKMMMNEYKERQEYLLSVGSTLEGSLSVANEYSLNPEESVPLNQQVVLENPDCPDSS